ncbi:unnamed protein product, partial [Fusarium graminearum]
NVKGESSTNLASRSQRSKPFKRIHSLGDTALTNMAIAVGSLSSLFTIMEGALPPLLQAGMIYALSSIQTNSFAALGNRSDLLNEVDQG